MRHFLLALMFATLVPAASAQFGSLTRIYPTLSRTKAELVDVDGDGIRDLLTLEAESVNRFQLMWSKGSQAPTFGPADFIATLDGQLYPISADGRFADGGDLDGDGHVDLVVATSAGLVRIDGGVGGQFSAPTLIAPHPCGHAQLIDLDLDGDLDVVSGAFVGTATPDDFFYLNDGLGGLSPRALSGTCCYYGVPMFTDADQDGDLDLVLTTTSAQRARYFENLGGLVFSNGTVISPLGTLPFLSLGDVDQDGDEDLLYANLSQLPGGWIENVAGAFSTNHVVKPTTASVSAPRVGDVDGDGDFDMVFVQDAYGSSWHPNDGNNQFFQALPIDVAREYASIIELVDLDGDQALDILISSERPHGIYAYLGLFDLGGDICAASANSTGVPAALRASGSRSVSANRFTLTLHDAPPGQLAAHLVGRTSQLSTLPGSAGTLCLGAPFGIFRGAGQIQPIDASGSFRLAIDLSSLPTAAGLLAAQSGETWLFQSLFRDFTPLGSSNLSPAIEVTFVP